MAVRTMIERQFQVVAKEHKQTLARLSDDLPLLESGLDSLSIAVVVARLEDALNVDPFSSEELIEFPVTFGDFIAAYQNAVSRQT